MLRNRNLTRWLVAVSATAATLLAGTACSSESGPAAGAGALAAGLQDKMSALAGGSGALAALGELGQQNGAADQVKQLATKLTSDNKGVVDQLRQAGSAVGITLPDGTTPDAQAALDQLKQKSGTEFDQSWLQTVQTTQQNASSAASDLAGVPGLPPQLSQVAQDAATRLTADQEQTKQAADAVGAPGAGAGTDQQGPAAAQGQNSAGSEPGTGSNSSSNAGTGTAAGQQAPTTAGAPQPGSAYTVQRGDTLSSIAQRAYGNPHDEQKIAAANNIADHDVILPGQTINIP